MPPQPLLFSGQKARKPIIGYLEASTYLRTHGQTDTDEQTDGRTGRQMEKAKKTYSHWFLLGWMKWRTDRWTDGQMDRQADKRKVRLTERQRCNLGIMSTYTCVWSYLGFGRSKFKFKKKTKLFGFNFSTNLDHAEHGSFIHLGMRVVWSDNPHCSRNNVPFPRKWQSQPMKKTVSRSGGNISINSKPIFKKHTRYRSEKEFPTIWVFAQLCSFNRLEVMSLYPSLYKNFLPR